MRAVVPPKGETHEIFAQNGLDGKKCMSRVEQERHRAGVNAQRQTTSHLLAKRFPDTLEESKKFAAYFAQISDFDTFTSCPLLDFAPLPHHPATAS